MQDHLFKHLKRMSHSASLKRKKATGGKLLPFKHSTFAFYVGVSVCNQVKSKYMCLFI